MDTEQIVFLKKNLVNESPSALIDIIVDLAEKCSEQELVSIDGDGRLYWTDSGETVGNC